MSKKNRLLKIVEIIEKYAISTQEELTEKLTFLGFDVSQSTVSRDIKELNLVKVETNGGVKYAKVAVGKKISEQIINLFKQITISIEVANNLIVIKTLNGNASAAGMAIDEMDFPQVLGTVAGDDTVLIVAKSNADADVVVKSLRTL